MAANQNVLQLTQQTVSANSTSVFYAVINSTTDTGIPLAVLVNNLGLTGIPTTPTAASNTNTTQIASCAFVQSVVGAYAPLAGATFTGSVTIPTLTITGSIGGSALSTYLSSPPAIGNITASSGAFTTLSASSTVSGTGFSTYLASPPAIGGVAPASGSFTTLGASGLISPTSSIGIKGTATNDNAQAGSIGEYVTANQPVGQALTTLTNLNVITISLTAGDWDVQGFAEFGGTSTTAWTFQAAGISTTSATFGGIGTTARNGVPYTGASPSFDLVTPTVRLQLTTTTTVYLVCVAQFTTSTAQVVGLLRARRVR